MLGLRGLVGKRFPPIRLGVTILCESSLLCGAGAPPATDDLGGSTG